MRRRFALIACSNGYGHVHRQARLAAALADRGHTVTLLAPRAAAKRALGDVAARQSISILDFETMTSAARLRAGAREATRWEERLPDLDAFDCVVSDNLPEVLARRPDAVLMGNFLWHEAVEGCAPEYVSRSRELLAQRRPRMIASMLFAAPYLSDETRLSKVGLFDDRRCPKGDGADLLIAVGRGGEAEAIGERFVRQLAGRRPHPFARIHVEPSLLPSDPPGWMVAATFSREMYACLAAGLCRPGVGALTDLLLCGARPFMFYELGNREMRDNASAIESADLGKAAAGPEEAFAMALKFMEDPSVREDHRARAARLDRGGSEQAAILLTTWAAGDAAA